jgi:hypothetical protein
MGECRVCHSRLAENFRFCPWCATPQRLKLVEFFRPSQAVEGDRGRALRVSRYLGTEDEPSHVRFSVWNEAGEAEAAISLDPPEARRLSRFLSGPARARHRAERGFRSRVADAARLAGDLLRVQ